MEVLSKDPEAREKVTTAAKEQITAIAAAHGIPLTEADFAPSEEDQKMDPGEFESVDGGLACACILGGGGEATHPGQQVCACVMGGLGDYNIPSGLKNRCACPAVGGGTDDYDDCYRWG